MPSLRRMSGREVVAVFERYSFSLHSQRGSHVKLRRIGATGEQQNLTIPMHDELDTGTLRAIIRQASRFIDVESLNQHFYR